MATLDFTIGRQLLAVQITQGGQSLPLDPNVITSFETSPDTDQKKHLPISGIVTWRNFFQGGKISISATRLDGYVMNFFIQQERFYYNSYLPNDGSIIVTVGNSDLTTSQYLYTGTQVKLDGEGPWTGDNFVDLKLTGVYSRLDQLS